MEDALVVAATGADVDGGGVMLGDADADELVEDKLELLKVKTTVFVRVDVVVNSLPLESVYVDVSFSGSIEVVTSVKGVTIATSDEDSLTYRFAMYW
jgi:hypothetical protein